MRPDVETQLAQISNRCWEWGKWHGRTTGILFASRMDSTWLFSVKPWTVKRIYWHLLNTARFCDQDAVGTAIRAAFAMWAPDCGITFQRRKHAKQAHIRVLWGLVLPNGRALPGTGYEQSTIASGDEGASAGEGVPPLRGPVSCPREPFAWTQPVAAAVPLMD